MASRWRVGITARWRLATCRKVMQAWQSNGLSALRCRHARRVANHGTTYVATGWTERCDACRSLAGRMGDLDAAVRASGDDPQRIPQWAAMRGRLREQFGRGLSDSLLLERLQDYLLANHAADRNELLRMKLDAVESIVDGLTDRPIAVGVALTQEDLAIMDALASSVHRSVTQAEIEAVSLVARRTIGKRLDVLRNAGYVKHPDGRKRGECITDQGRNVLSEAAAAKDAH